MTQTQALILSLLVGGEKYGLELIGESKGHLKRGTVYVLLARLKESGFITSKSVKPKAGEQGPARQVYRITSAGGRALKEWRDAQQGLMGILGLET